MSITGKHLKVCCLLIYNTRKCGLVHREDLNEQKFSNKKHFIAAKTGMDKQAVLPETPNPLVKTDENLSQNVPEKDHVQDMSLDSSEEKLSEEKDHVLKHEKKENETVEKKCNEKDEKNESVEEMDISTPNSAKDEPGICIV